MEPAKQIAFRFFSSIGFAPEEIPETNELRADIRAHDGDCEYITEVKEKLDDPETLACQISIRSDDDNNIGILASPLGRSNRLDGIFKTGAKQLSLTPTTENAFRLIWLHCEGFDAKHQVTRARSTFYGVVPVLPAGGENGCMCLYFDFNTSFMLPQVNGILISVNNGLQLFINEFAESADAFRSSKLCNILAGAIFDPTEVLEHESHIAFRGNISRKDESRVLDELEKQTGTRYRTARMNHYLFYAPKPT
jgi:hypothetical protein